MLDEAAVRKVAEDYCEQYRKHAEITIVGEIACANPASTYFSLRHSEDMVGGIVGILVFHDTGKYRDFGTGWYYGTVDDFCKKIFGQNDPAFVFEALLHPLQFDNLDDMARKRGIDWEKKLLP